MNRKFSPFTIRLLSRIVLVSIFLLSVFFALLLLPIVLFLVSFLGCVLLAIFLMKKFVAGKKQPPTPHNEYEIEVFPIREDELKDSLDDLQKSSKGKKIEPR